jgi:hypothetical protein
MRALKLVAAALLFVSLGHAQRHGINSATMSPVRAMPAPVGATPFGNILFPGGVPSFPPSHPIAVGGTISGSIPYTGVRPGGGPGGRYRTTVVPYAVPVFGGYGYGYGYGYPQQPAEPNLTVVMPQQPTPTVIINNHYSSPEAAPKTSVSVEDTRSGGIKVYEANPRPSETAAAQPEAQRTGNFYVRDDKPNIYLIAMNDRTVRQAIGYWVKGESLHYVTPGAKIEEVRLSDVDREASVKLNQARKLEFDLAIQ